MSDNANQSRTQRRLAASLASAIPDSSNPPAVAAREIELKLIGERGAVESAFEAVAGGAAGSKPRARNLMSTYFDTADGALRGKNHVFRVRKVFNRCVATLKWKQQAFNSHIRGEFEARLPSMEPDVAALPPKFAERLHAATGGEPLLAQFITRINRRAHLVNFGGATIEVALDIGAIFAGDRHMTVRELELELKRGEIAALYEFAEVMSREHGLNLAPLTKSERGFSLAIDQPPRERRSRAPETPAQASLDEIIEIVTGECLEQFTANWPAFDGARKTEPVHQIRVALRRLRTALSMFNRALPNPQFEYFRAQAKSLAAAFGPTRDMDVFIALVEDGPVAHYGRDSGFDALLATAVARRENGCARASAALADSQTSRFVLELRAFVARRGWRNSLESDELMKLDELAPSFAERTLKRLDKRARKLGKKIHELGAEERHDLRIALKNIRYAAEFFGGLFGASEVKKYNRRAAKLQDVLGDYNDAVMAYRIVSQLEEQVGQESARAAGVVIGWCGRGSFDSDAPLLEAWKAFSAVERFW